MNNVNDAREIIMLKKKEYGISHWNYYMLVKLVKISNTVYFVRGILRDVTTIKFNVPS